MDDNSNNQAYQSPLQGVGWSGVSGGQLEIQPLLRYGLDYAGQQQAPAADPDTIPEADIAALFTPQPPEGGASA